ncbi:MAG: FlgD immunoglobulin-like domain containing protein [Candidatus Marinimicrobia bacterium]|nr:FlgD immunoglobulin-like domain containing protein [Candidatus Neomarinimicrobiota bacterium]
MSAWAVSDVDGNFGFDHVFGTLALFPEKNDGISDVDGFDLLRLKNSLLEISTLSADETLAADCDGNAHVDGLDLLRLKNYLLMIPVDPPALTWDFRPIGYFYNPITEDMSGQNFEAYIHGDVNLSWGTSSSVLAKTSDAENVRINFKDFSLGEDGYLHLPVYTENDLLLAMLDWEICYDTTAFTFIGMNSSFINDHNRSGNTINLLWLYDGEEMSIERNSIMVDLVFKPASGQSGGTIYFSGSHLAAADETPIQAEYGSITIDLAMLALLENGRFPEETTLYRNYPNPFNPGTQIPYYLKEASAVTVKIYNLRGETVHTYRKVYQDAGFHQLTWNGCDDHGRPVPTGIYLYQFLYQGGMDVKRMVLMK